jgi:hypothetical protein
MGNEKTALTLYSAKPKAKNRPTQPTKEKLKKKKT